MKPRDPRANGVSGTSQRPNDSIAPDHMTRLRRTRMGWVQGRATVSDYSSARARRKAKPMGMLSLRRSTKKGPRDFARGPLGETKASLLAETDCATHGV